MVDISPNLSRAIGERKYLAYHVVPLFKFYERTFNTIDFDWAETHMSSAKIMKSQEDSGIILADAKGTRIGGLSIFACQHKHMSSVKMMKSQEDSGIILGDSK